MRSIGNFLTHGTVIFVFYRNEVDFWVLTKKSKNLKKNFFFSKTHFLWFTMFIKMFYWKKKFWLGGSWFQRGTGLTKKFWKKFFFSKTHFLWFTMFINMFYWKKNFNLDVADYSGVYASIYIYICNYHLIQIRNFHSNIISRYAIDRESLLAVHCHIRFS